MNMFIARNKRVLTSFTVALLLCLTLILGGCSNNSNYNESEVTTDEPVSDKITYTATNGEITFPRNPQRVVDVSDT